MGHSVASAETIAKSTFKDLEKNTGNYTVELISNNTDNQFLKTSGIFNAMNVTGELKEANLQDVNIKLKGIVGYQARGLQVTNDGDITIENYTQNNNLTASDVWYNPDTPDTSKTGNEITSMYAEKGSHITVNGNTYIHSIVNPISGKEEQTQIAHNGVYSYGNGTVIDLKGDVYVNTNIPNGLEEVYEAGYKGGASKNDAVTAKREGIVNINTNGSHTVQILGNLDVKGYEDGYANGDKGGTINVRLDTADSYWHGEEVRYDYDVEDTVAEKANLNVTLANGAQWMPDRETTQISKITLEKDGVINLHGLDLHTSNKGLTEHLTINNLNTDGGIFRIDASGATTDEQGQNDDTDFIQINAGSGTAYVQPIDNEKLNGVSKDNPVWFSNAADGITFKPYLEEAAIEEGLLYDYKPIVAEDYIDGYEGTNGTHNWYLIGLDAETTPSAETTIASAAVNYATATARLEIDSLNKRLGELRNYDTDEKGVWVRYKGGELESDTDSYFKNKYHFYQIGYDAKEDKNAEKDGIWHKGFAIHYTDADTNYKYANGENDSIGASLYAGWAGNKGHYADYVLKYSHLDNEFTVYDSTGTATGDYSNWAISASAEYGRKKDMGNQWFFEPQTQLVYTYITDADYTTSNGIQVAQDNVNSLIGRLGFRLGREYDQDDYTKRNKWYIKADVLHEFAGDRDVRLLGGNNQTLYRSENGNDTWFVVGFGSDVVLSKKTHFYWDVEKSFGGDIEERWQINGGFRWEW